MHRVQTHTAWLKYFFKALYGVLLRASSASVRACASSHNIPQNTPFINHFYKQHGGLSLVPNGIQKLYLETSNTLYNTQKHLKRLLI